MTRGPAKTPYVQSNPLAMTDAELCAAFGDMLDSELMRGLIMAEARAIREGAERERRTMRNLWYDHIKPVLSRAGRLDDKTSGGNDVDWPSLLSKYLAELVRAGQTSYEELYIVDGSRQRRPAADVARTMASVRLVGGHYPWLILFTEKDTIWNELEGLASLYGVSAISGGGQPAAACTADIVRQILASEAYNGEALTLLTLTDYDPSGDSIAKNQYVQLGEAAAGACEVRHDRLGLTPEQLTREERDAKAYTPKRAGFAKWYRKTGGVDGRPLGLELDALPLSRLRAMFAAGIEQYIDLAPRRGDLRDSLLELVAWDLLRPDMEERKAAMIAQVKSNGLWERVRLADIPGDLFSEAARMGWRSIDPVATTYGGMPLFDCVDALREAMEMAKWQ